MNGVHRVWAALALGGMLATGCGREVPGAGGGRVASGNGRPAPVGVATARSEAYEVSEEAIGTVRAVLHAGLEAKIAGRVAAVKVVPGQEVKAGDLLVQLDVREIEARLDQARAQADQAEQDLRRSTALVERNAVTRQEHDAALARQRVSRGALAEAEVLLGYSRILSPFDGVITRKLADVGDLAVPGRALLEIEDPTRLRLEADVPESLVGEIHPGATLPVRVGGGSGELPGVVSEIAPSADTVTRTIRVKLDLPSARGLRSGLFGRVDIPIGTSLPAIRVPHRAIVRRGQMEVLFLVESGRAVLRLVKTGRRIGEDLEILSGLNPGEQVVVRGAETLADGSLLEIQP
ncbi:MAG TPA: efflux RND transporter periplasmic adaptor subunit [Verrucomicrobiales bacterium]|nr:efflux RND transporter periplasmic adaptor subunit [Verrucomicrobiales bacterium]